jgi:hypothetical protein
MMHGSENVKFDICLFRLCGRKQISCCFKVMSGRFPGVSEDDHGKLSPNIRSLYTNFNSKPQETKALRNIPQHQAFEAKVQVIFLHTMKTYGRKEVRLQTFLASALNGSE